VADQETTTGTTMTDLENGTTYEVQVAAISTEGQGAFTASVSATPLRPVVDAPAITLSVDRVELRSGETIKLTWSSERAETITASGDWNGEKATSGIEEIVLDGEGAYSFVLTAEGEGGDTTAKVDVPVALAPATLVVSAPSDLIRVGRSATIGASGLAPGEAYRIEIGGSAVGTGSASADGSLSATVVVPASLKDGKAPVRVVGSLEDRAGQATLDVVAARKLTVKVSKQRVRRGFKQRVSVSGLAAGEPVRIMFRSKRVAGGKATARGTFSGAFRVGKTVGKRTVKAFGITNDRSGARTFRVTR
jgi:plastocyanin